MKSISTHVQKKMWGTGSASMGQSVILRKHIPALCLGRSFALCILLVLLCSAASSMTTFQLGVISRAIAADENIQGPVLIFLVAFVVTMIMRPLSSYMAEVWNIDAIGRAFATGVSVVRDRPTLFAEKQLRESHSSAMAGNIIDLSTGVTRYVYELGMVSLSSITSIFIVAHFTSSLLVWTYGFSLTVSTLVAVWGQRKLKNYGARAEKYRIRFGELANKVWPNVVAGNKFDCDRFDQHSRRVMNSFGIRRLGVIRFSVVLQGTLALIAFVPTLSALLWPVFFSSSQSNVLSSLLLLPPTMVALNSQAQIVSMISVVGLWNGRFSAISVILEKPDAKEIEQRIDSNSLRVQATPPIDSLKTTHLERWIGELGHGCRVTIRGRNGAGKTSLLLKIKEILGANAYFYSYSDQLLLGGTHIAQSTGQRLRRHIETISKVRGIRFLLLDEWDAGLDTKNIALMSARLEKICKKGVNVIEVRHRSN